MYDLADGYDSWLDRLDALNAETTDAPTPPAAPLPPRIFNAAALDKLRAARDNADFMLSVAFAHGYKYPHRSHRHQRGEES